MLSPVVIAPDAIDLGGSHDGKEADYIRPDVIEDEESDQGENADTDGSI